MEPMTQRAVGFEPRTDDKYLVFKQEDFWHSFYDDEPMQDLMKRIRVHDAVVIRKQDVFAGPALHTYAATIALVAVTVKNTDPTLAEELQHVADYFSDCAMDADAMQRKFPD